jgi:transposase
MIRLASDTQVLIATKAQDFRKGIDGFAGLCTNHFQHNPRSGAVYAFINRSGTMVRLLAYEHNGYWLMTKRLSKGSFRAWPKSTQPMSAVAARQLRQLLNNGPDASVSFNPQPQISKNNV